MKQIAFEIYAKSRQNEVFAWYISLELAYWYHTSGCLVAKGTKYRTYLYN